MGKTETLTPNSDTRIAILDVETANSKEKGSICAIGIVLMHGNRVIDTL
jgi:DNA polymerase III epsilon subunit-like protein